VKSAKLLFIFGTRPEAIKLAPLIIELRKHISFEVKVCVTAQHRHMLDQVLNFFGISPDYDLDIMKPDQTLFDVTASSLKLLEGVLDDYKPDCVFVQGDTTTSFTGALAAYYMKIKIAHVEAGLRSDDKYSPFPEEINRKLVTHLADFHFAPTFQSALALEKENISDNIFTVGNTVIDALMLGLEILKNNNYKVSSKDLLKDITGRIVLITGHRRESFGKPFGNICEAIRQLAEKYPDADFIYPVHLNPNVREPVNRILKGHKNIHLVEPVDYPGFIWLMNKSYLVLTDSGGIQEEAPSLGKPVLVMRNVTERQEGIDAGTAKLVGTEVKAIVEEVSRLMDDEAEYSRMARSINPYGDGTASRQIAALLPRLLKMGQAVNS
jgi:UDP-N-acetylglucosamine 2-epimerase (non-hydrolysing)